MPEEPIGYLPERAARRARKIVLRAPLGLGWIVASVLAGVVLLVAGAVFLLRSTGPPGPPFVAVGRVETLGAAAVRDDLGVLVVTVGGVRAFPLEPHRPRYCPTSGRLESPDGRVWSTTGRALDGGPSLPTHPVVVHEGIVYVDPTRSIAGPPPAQRPGVTPRCVESP